MEFGPIVIVPTLDNKRGNEADDEVLEALRTFVL